MSLTRLKYGIETDPRDRRNESSGLGWIVVAIVVVAAVSFIVTVLGRISSESDAVSRSEDPAPAVEAQSRKASEILSDVPPVNIGRLEGRSPKLRSLLLRLEKCAEAGELEMQISTIEQILALRTADAADVADELLPRLGQLNLSWLFDRNNPQWVARIKVKSGDTASRIASEHGSTLASFMKLNGLTDAARLVVGREMKVMNHPRFYLVLRSRLRAVDLYLNGKIFKRYFIVDGAKNALVKPGDYRTPANLTGYFGRCGIELREDDMKELDMMVPRNTRFMVIDS